LLPISASSSFSCNLLTSPVSRVKFGACVVQFVKLHVLLNKNQLIQQTNPFIKYFQSVPHSRSPGSSSVLTFFDSHASLCLPCSSPRSRRLSAASVICSFSLVHVTLNFLYLLILCCLISASSSFSCDLLTSLVSLVKFRACVVKFVKFHVLLNKNQLIKKKKMLSGRGSH
jgi:hypothetical protein